MQTIIKNIDKLIYYRLIALWILSEAMLGGILHGFKIPATGLIVGSCAVICISLIAYCTPAKGSILKATLIVTIFKMMLSPQAPLPAYFAVFFQGIMGETLFWKRKMYPFSCLLFAVMVMLESALQRIIILTVIYGNDLWKAINQFINGLTGQLTLTNYSFIFVMGYVLLHFIIGIVIGLLVGRLPNKIRAWAAIHKNYLLKDLQQEEIVMPTRKSKKMKKFMLVWLILLIVYIQSYYHFGPIILPSQAFITLFIRSLLILLTCYFLIGPLLTWFLNKWLEKQKMKEAGNIHKISQLLPDTAQLIKTSWQLAAIKKGISRFILCGKIILLNTFYPVLAADDF